MEEKIVATVVSSSPSLATLLAALQAQGHIYVGTRGNLRAPTCVLGEAPGENEVSMRLPFVGFSGKLLDQMLSEVGFSQDDVWFFNAYQARPPENDIKRIEELRIPLQLFHAHFFEVLQANRPRIIVACGKTVTNLLCPETKPKRKLGAKQEDKEGFGNWRGSLLTSPYLGWPHYVIPMYHPAYVLRNYEEREICVLILRKAWEETAYWKSNNFIQPLPIRRILVSPGYGEALNYFARCMQSTEPISTDIELLRRSVPYTISFAISPWDAVALSLWNYSTTELVSIWRSINEVLKRKRLIGQNFTSFDAHWLRRLGFTVNLPGVEDTLERHHILWPELLHRLEFQTLQYTREPYYKEEGKGWSPRDSLDRLLLYNGKDSTVTYEVWLEQEKEFQERAA